MFNSKQHRRAGVALFALATSGIVAFGGQASARVTEEDSVLIDSTGFDLGGDGFTSGSPDESATLEWDHAWYGVVPTLFGKIHFDGVNNGCARIKLISYDQNGVANDTDFSDTECAPTNGHHARTIVDDSGSGDLTGRGGSAKVKVILQTLNQNGSWGNVGSRTKVYGPEIDSDDVLVSRADFDFGASGLTGGAPTDPGTLTWNSTGSVITATLDGELYIKNSSDLCGRVRLRTLDDAGLVLDNTFSDDECAPDDDLHTFPVSLDGTPSNDVAEVKVTVQKRGGSGGWQAVGSQTVALN